MLRDGPVLGGDGGRERVREREGGGSDREEETGERKERGNTTQHRLAVEEPARSSSSKQRRILLFPHREGLFLRSPRVQEEGVTHAKLGENGGIRDRRGRAVVRPAGHGAG